ncbi:Uncharacterized protein AXF42_Ash011079 [Apostasia shenzhenica]|uniref:PHD and RING finger domain-containing protein 1 n=1 Tax=Apostasia shenzhenica TaxID=1088818 RepID=A0A2H9ZR22_9ASPA|nr:Uncharacterized protein AXF42_Ash011079 [Apostasia shenzhenica]
MDLEVSTDDESEATFLDDEDCNVDSEFDERCGICLDIVIDRGVLDCCDHWFCFACIDNWATITNLCPICKSDFQLITCLPVFDTIGCLRSEKHALSSNADWCVQGKNNTLSFPSYYISEDIVRCLEGDQCKMRSGSQIAGDDLTCDTSIACDSCDIWYHALCVGFNPELAFEKSWLCPRCISNEVQCKSDAVSLPNLGKYAAQQSAATEWPVDPFLLGKVSVSVADAGETALVVSLIDGQQKASSKNSILARLDADIEDETVVGESELQANDDYYIQLSSKNLVCSPDKGVHVSAVDADINSEAFFDILPEIMDVHPDIDLKEPSFMSSFSEDASMMKQRNDISDSLLLPSIFQDMPLPLCYSAGRGDDDKHLNMEETRTDSFNSDVCEDLPKVACDLPSAKDELNSKSGEMVHVSMAASSPSAENLDTGSCKDMELDMCQNNRKAGKLILKHRMDQPYTIKVNQINDCHASSDFQAHNFTKKLKSEGTSKMLPPQSQCVVPLSDSSHGFSRNNGDASFRSAKPENAETSDIMSIVQENDCASHEMPVNMTDACKLRDKKDGICGLRVKKILRNVGDKKETSILAQKLGKEIREVVHKKGLKDIGKNNALDERLLEAFRSAMVKPKIEVVSKSQVFRGGAKKHILLKGKTRENLTKKIYGTASGRRRHAWVRDLEVEFWKHRCGRAEPEKVETLQSVLELLKKATDPYSDSSARDQACQEEAAKSILSRVYLADASLFPRKADIKPLSSQSESSEIEKYNLNLEKKAGYVSTESLAIDQKNSRQNPSGTSKSSVRLNANLFDLTGKSLHAPSFHGESSNNGVVPELKSAASSCSKRSVAISKEQSCPSDARSEKRKWALEFLARRADSMCTTVDKRKEDHVLLKGKYPLIAQLPRDMHPVPASSCHNKVSVSIRQSQLYRITEHYLRKTNQSVIRRTAETELAVADAVNAEKEIFERSNSKLVYVNLCSQALSHHSNRSESAERSVSDSKIANSEVHDEVAEVPTSQTETVGWSNVEEALKMAGLYSDSPPSSPFIDTKDSNEYETSQRNMEETLTSCANDNILFSANTEQDASSCQSTGKETSARNESAAHDCNNLSGKLQYDFFNASAQEETGAENSKENVGMDECLLEKISEGDAHNEPYLQECRVIHAKVECRMNRVCDKDVEVLMKQPLDSTDLKNTFCVGEDNYLLKDENGHCMLETKSCTDNLAGGSTLIDDSAAGRENSQTCVRENSKINSVISPNQDDVKATNEKSLMLSISKKVEAYIKEHIRPLYKSGVITVEQYRWAAGKSVDKVMKFHRKAKNANFLIKEGEKVKKLAEQYVEAAQQKELK